MATLMIVTCPLCATRYDADSKAFEPDGRKVRCTNCSNTWFQETEAAERARLEQDAGADDLSEQFEDDYGDDITDIETEAARLASASRRASKGYAANRMTRRRAVYGWLSLAACITLFVFGGYQLKVPIVKTFPAAALIYAQLGIEVNTRGLAFHNLTYKQEYENGVQVMAIKGNIVNVTEEPLVIPRVRFGLLDGTAREIYHWNIKVTQKPLAPNETLQFSSRLASPPVAARNLQVRFARMRP